MMLFILVSIAVCVPLKFAVLSAFKVGNFVNILDPAASQQPE